MPSETGQRPLGVLLVDDEALLRRRVRETVPWEALGMEVAGEAGGAEEALRLVEALRPQIVLLDISMPRLNGLDLVPFIKRRVPEVKIIVLTGHTDLDHARKGVRAGVYDYLLKPLDRAELRDALERAGAACREADRAEAEAVPEVSAGAEGVSGGSWLDVLTGWIDRRVPCGSVSLEEAAGEFAMHPSSLTRRVKRETGRSFGDLVAERRLAKLLELLDRRTDLLTYELGAFVGIDDPHYLSIFFRKRMGVSISEYRTRKKGTRGEAGRRSVSGVP